MQYCALSKLTPSGWLGWHYRLKSMNSNIVYGLRQIISPPSGRCHNPPLPAPKCNAPNVCKSQSVSFRGSKIMHNLLHYCLLICAGSPPLKFKTKLISIRGAFSGEWTVSWKLDRLHLTYTYDMACLGETVGKSRSSHPTNNWLQKRYVLLRLGTIAHQIEGKSYLASMQNAYENAWMSRNSLDIYALGLLTAFQSLFIRVWAFGG